MTDATLTARMCLALAAAVLGNAVAPPSLAARTVTTVYQYNADGALTAETTRTDGGAPQTTYLTWDNFTPDGGDPSTGSASAGDGNLLGLGASPGVAEASTQFAYDARDRLIGCNAADQPAATFAYHPASLMASSTLASGDALGFYYGNGGAPRMTNLRQPSTGTAASFLGPVYYLSDGTEQALLGPRKDTAGVYAPADQLLTPYAYEPYGAAPIESRPSPLASGGASYDLGENPFRYAGEYEDPTCRAYYLRARWYLPAQQAFLSRDRVERLQRYGYTGGNPINRTDPTGLSWYATFRGGTNRFLGKLGLGGTALSLLPGIGEGMFALQLAANGGAYFHSWSDVAMLGLGAATVASGGLEGIRDLAPLERQLGRGGVPSTAAGFAGRLGLDALIGGGQSVIAGFGGGTGKRFDTAAFLENVGVTAGSMLVGRVGAGIGYRPFRLDASDVDRHLASHFNDGAAPQDALVYRMRQRTRIGALALGGTSPLTEDARFNLTSRFPYHEGVLAVTADNVWYSSLQTSAYFGGERMDASRTIRWARENGAVGATQVVGASPSVKSDFNFVGRVPAADVDQLFAGLHPQSSEAESYGGHMRFTNEPHRPLNNCHRYVAQLLSQLN